MNNPITQFANYSLRTKLTLTFLVISVFSVVAITATMNYVIRDRLIQEVSSNLKTLADAQAVSVGGLLIRQVENLQALSFNKILQDVVEVLNLTYRGDPATIQTRLEEVDRQWVAASDTDNLIQSYLNNEIASQLDEYRRTFPANAEIFVTDRYGALVAATDRTPDYYQADEEWWQATFNNGQGNIYLGQPEFDESTNTIALIIAVPLYAFNTDEVVGVLRTTYRLDGLIKLLAPTEAQIASIDVYLPGGKVINPETNALEASDAATVAQLQALANLGYGQFIYEGDPSLVAQAPVRAVTGESAVADLDWTVVVHQHEDEALALVETQTQTALVLALVIIILAAVVGVIVAQLLTRPITRLTTAAQQVAAGNLEVQTLAEAGDEIGQLAQAFNGMTAQLRSLIGSLEDQVRERTADLALSMSVGQRAAAIRELSELLPTITEFIREQFNLYYTQVYFLDDLGQNLVLKAGTGEAGQELLARRHSLPVRAGSIVGRVAVGRKSIVVSDTQNSDMHLANPLLPATRSELAIPLMVEDRVIGVLDMQADQVNTFTEDNVTVFEAMATQLAVSIDSAQQWALAQEAQRKSEEAVRQLTRQGWAEGLASRQESLAFAYDLSLVEPLSKGERMNSEEAKLAVPIVVQNEPIGQLAVAPPPAPNFVYG